MRTIIEIEAHLDRTGITALGISGSRPAEAVRLCTTAILEAEQVENAPRSLINQIGRLRLTLSTLYIQLMIYDKALESALEAHKYFTEIKLESGVARSLSAVGLAKVYLGVYVEGLENFIEVRNFADRENDQRLKSRVLSHLGFLYLRMEEFTVAQDYLTQSLALMTSEKSLQVEAGLLENLSVVYLNQGDFNQALSYGQESVQQYQAENNPQGESKALNRVGEIYFLMGLADEALAHYHAALEICEETEYKPGAAKSHTLIGEMAFQQGNNTQALHHLVMALEFAEACLNQKRVFEVHLLLSQVYQQEGRYQEALEHYRLYHEIKEAVFDDDIATKIKSLEIIHRLQETQKDRETFRLENVALMREIEERTKVQTELERIVTLDPLTELKNRRHFFELVQREMERSQRYSRPLSMIMLDIDHFKMVNDQFGHLVGDKVIVEVSIRILKTLRKVDVACRYGGEEFAILLPETPLDQAMMVANRLWRIISKLPAVSSELKISITASFGVASYEGGGSMTPDTLLDRADQALYIAKNNGRNQVAAYGQVTKSR